MSISTAADATTVEPGGSVGYTLTIANTGQTAYTAASVSDSLVGVLDDATYAGDAVATRGTVTYTAPTLTWTGDLAAGAVATITYSVTVRSPDPGDRSMDDEVSSAEAGSSCPPTGGGAGCSVTVRVLTPALTISTSADTASTTLGATVVFTVSVVNTGRRAIRRPRSATPWRACWTTRATCPGRCRAAAAPSRTSTGCWAGRARWRPEPRRRCRTRCRWRTRGRVTGC